MRDNDRHEKLPTEAMLRLLFAMSTLAFVTSCTSPGGEPERPFGMETIESGALGFDFDEFIDLSARESESFRRSFLVERADAVLELTASFPERAAPFLTGRPSLHRFSGDRDTLAAAVRGRSSLSGHDAFADFAGRWYGLWDANPVDHHWGPVVEFDPPREVEFASGENVWVKSYQYAWIGDGYGINLVASERASQAGDFVLGYVVHVAEQDLSQPRLRRPHVGVFAGDGRLIWITASEVFLEERLPSSETQVDEAYAITGFFYAFEKQVARPTSCFQAVYSRSAEHRTPFFQFRLDS